MQDDIKTQAQAEKMLFMVYGKCLTCSMRRPCPTLSGGDDLISELLRIGALFLVEEPRIRHSRRSPRRTPTSTCRGTTSGLPTGNYSYNIYEGIRYTYKLP